VLVAPLALLHLRAADVRWRRGALAVAVAMAAALVLSGTRGAWLGTLVAVAIWWPARSASGSASPATPEPGPRSTAARWGPVAAAGAVAVVLVVAALAGPMLERSTAGGRIDLWRTTVEPIAERPILGSGPDSQRIVLPAGIDRRFEQRHGSEELHDRAHQLVLDTWITTGVLGVIALGGLLIVIGRALARHRREQLAVRAIAAGLAGYLVHLAFAFGDVTLDPLAWLLAGIGIGALPLVAAGADAEVPVAADRPHRLAAGAFALVAIVAVVAGVGELVADRHLARAVELDAEGDRIGALDELESALALAPHRWDLPQARARVAERLLVGGSPLGGELDPRRDPEAFDELVADALDDVDRALAAAPGDPDLLMDRAALLAAAGRPAEAEDAFRAVLAGPYPQSSRAWLGLGSALAVQDQPDAAIEAWEQAAQLAPSDWRALANLAALHTSAGRDDDALAAVEEGLRRQPDEPSLLALQAQLTG
jgi:tetratricopeptide (TPR) repeat protein